MLIPILIIVAVALFASRSPKSSAILGLPNTPDDEPPKIEAWKARILTERINAHVRTQQEAELINLAQEAFASAPAVVESTRKKS